MLHIVALLFLSADESALIGRHDLKCFYELVTCTDRRSDRGAISPEGLKNEGPFVQLRTPLTSPIVSPTALRIDFSPNGAAIDLASLRVSARKWMGITFSPSRDVTNRVVPYATEKGIAWPDARLEPGKYEFQLRVADSLSRSTVVRFTLEVARRQ